jgi:putative DNA primase/helicase
MELIDFARAHGILIDRLPKLGVWRRYPTESHPHKRNGAIKFMGDVAFVQNHSVDTEVTLWKPDADVKPIDYFRMAKLAQEAEALTRRKQIEAAQKAKDMLSQCQIGRHEYLKAKGFEDEQGHILKTDDGQVLVIPMFIQGRLVGAQQIRSDGTKRFIYGQKTSFAAHVFDNKGPHILVEGYATGLAVRMALKAMKRKYTIHVCFSAGNMAKVAAQLPGGFIVADNDESLTGEKMATSIGWPFWMSSVVGEDAHDTWRRLGLFKFSQSLTRSMKIF